MKSLIQKCISTFLKSIRAQKIVALLLVSSILLTVFLSLGCGRMPDSDMNLQRRRPMLQLLRNDNWPHVFYFRMCERRRVGLETAPYEKWEAIFSKTMGLMSQALDEEHEEKWQYNGEFLTRFKRLHPEQAVFLHFNGRARMPEFEQGRFFDGHWLYERGCRVLSDIPDKGDEIEIRVEDPSLFYLGTGKKQRKSRIDIGLCRLREDGTLDWMCAEQVRLFAKDENTSTILVRRGRAGSKPRAFQAGKAWAAPHLFRGPFNGNFLWKYNFSLRCPRDAQGRTCADVFADSLCEKFEPGELLETFDGVDLDAIWVDVDETADCDADGEADGGIFSEVNEFSLGTYEMYQRIRERLGDDFIFMADGGKVIHQRAAGVLSGIESEEWPKGGDTEFLGWSWGLDRHFYWRLVAHEPAMSYIALLFRENPKREVREDGYRAGSSFSRARLTIAAALFTDSAIGLKATAPPESGELMALWDELKMGAENKLGWLGAPMGEARRLGLEAQDQLNGEGEKISEAFLQRWKGENVSIRRVTGSVRLEAQDSDAASIEANLTRLPVNGPDWLFSCTLRAEPLPNHPPGMPRRILLNVIPENENAEPMFDEAHVLEMPFVWVDQTAFPSTLYVRDINAKSVRLQFTIEGGEPVWISDITLHASPDAIVREYEHGIVLANPSWHEYVFDLGTLFPGSKLRRLTASSNQDVETNNGMSASGKLTLQVLDALFLKKE